MPRSYTPLGVIPYLYINLATHTTICKHRLLYPEGDMFANNNKNNNFLFPICDDTFSHCTHIRKCTYAYTHTHPLRWFGFKVFVFKMYGYNAHHTN